MSERFTDRKEAGRVLARSLASYKNLSDAIVLALPRGGVPVAFEVSQALNLPLAILVVRKLGVPGQSELAFGAITSGGIRVFNESLLNDLKIPVSMIDKVIEREEKELKRREHLYGSDQDFPDLRGKTVIIVDDGLATGATMRAAIALVRTLEPKQIIAAAPVASLDTCKEIRHRSDDLCICSVFPEPFYGVGLWYENFDQVSDEEVLNLIEKSRDVCGASA